MDLISFHLRHSFLPTAVRCIVKSLPCWQSFQWDSSIFRLNCYSSRFLVIFTFPHWRCFIKTLLQLSGTEHFRNRSTRLLLCLSQVTLVLPGDPSKVRYLGKSSKLGCEFGEHLSNMTNSKASVLVLENWWFSINRTTKCAETHYQVCKRNCNYFRRNVGFQPCFNIL